MSNKIYVTCNPVFQPMCELFFDDFKNEFNYFGDIELIYGNETIYEQYEKDLVSINSGMIPKAMIVDSRGLKGRENEPVRLLLVDNFFWKGESEQNHTILHELGHYFTDLDLTEIIQFISKFNDKALTKEICKTNKFLAKHNEELFFLLQIPKLPMDICAELWVYENELKISKQSLKRVCSKLINTISKFKNMEGDREVFFDIPRSNSDILFRLAVIKHVKFDFKEECLSNLKIIKELFIELARKSGWNDLKQVKYQNKILDYVEYKNFKIPKLKDLFEEIFKEYIKNSATFFPKDDQHKILDFYDFS